MKQGLICRIPKHDKDPLLIEIWRPITLLNVDYKILSLSFAKRLKEVLVESNKTQTGFMAKLQYKADTRPYGLFWLFNRSISTFSGFVKVTVEHYFLFKSLQTFGFWSQFISIVKMLYKTIDSCVMLYKHTSQRFPVARTVRPISPFLFLLETLSI